MGELVDCAWLHCQPSEVEYLGSYSKSDPHYVQAKTRYMRAALAPRPLLAETEIHHALMSSQVQGLLSPLELRLRAYYAISRGAKGVSFRGEFTDGDDRYRRCRLDAEVYRLGQELAVLRPLLSIGDFAEGYALCDEPTVEAASILCGDQAMVIILLNHDRQMSWPRNEMYQGGTFWVEPSPDPFDIHVRMPDEVVPTAVLEVGGRCTRPAVRKVVHGAEFRVDGIVGVRVFVIAFGSATADLMAAGNASLGPADQAGEDGLTGLFDLEIGRLVAETLTPVPGSLPTPTCVNGWERGRGTFFPGSAGGPDVRFGVKQVFLARNVDPGSEVRLRYPFRNVGMSPLVLKADEGDPRLAVDVPQLAYSPGEEGAVTLRFTPQVERFHVRARLRTNDPNKPFVALEGGGFVFPRARVIPPVVRFTLAPREYGAPIPQVRVRVWAPGKDPFEVLGIVTDSPLIGCSWSCEKRRVVLSYADPIGGVIERSTYDLAVSFTGSGPDVPHDGLTARVLLQTPDGPLAIPVQVTRQALVTCYPTSLFFGLADQPVTRRISLRSTVGAFSVRSVSCDTREITAAALPTHGDDWAEVDARLDPTHVTRKGLLTGTIQVTCERNEGTSTVSVPWSALAR
jgi:hypothetical protein